ncbi:unnamed protein product, partial [Prorocentrum cordatum]
MKAPPSAPQACPRPAWEVGASELLLRECLGAGATAEVHRALWHGTEVAVKRLRVCARAQFEKELHMLHELRHPNLVLFMGAVVASPPMIICEFCAGGTLFRLLHERPKPAFSWEKRRKVALDIAKGMLYLHRRGVIHRDLKSLNVLLAAEVGASGEAPCAKIADFGLSRHMPAAPAAEEGPPPSEAGQLTRGLGTYLWMAPEVLSGSAYDHRADVYSYAVVLYELACRRLPFEGTGLQPISVALAISSGARPDLCHMPARLPPRAARPAAAGLGAGARGEALLRPDPPEPVRLRLVAGRGRHSLSGASRAARPPAASPGQRRATGQALPLPTPGGRAPRTRRGASSPEGERRRLRRAHRKVNASVRCCGTAPALRRGLGSRLERSALQAGRERGRRSRCGRAKTVGSLPSLSPRQSR